MTKLRPDVAVTFPVTVIVDSREQHPFPFAGLHADARDGGGPLAVTAERGTLRSGDYSLRGLEEVVAVERKSIEDLYGTIGQGRDRFVRELERLASFRVAAVVVEAEWSTILFDPPAHTQLSPKTIFRSVVAWQQRYPRCHWWFCADRRHAEITTLRVLERAWKDLHGCAATDDEPAVDVPDALQAAALDLLRLHSAYRIAPDRTDRRLLGDQVVAAGAEMARAVLRGAGRGADRAARVKGGERDGQTNES